MDESADGNDHDDGDAEWDGEAGEEAQLRRREGDLRGGVAVAHVPADCRGAADGPVSRASGARAWLLGPQCTANCSTCTSEDPGFLHRYSSLIMRNSVNHTSFH